GVARKGFELARGGVLPLALLPAPCVLREHALESVKRVKRSWKIAFTGSSIVSVQAAVCAGLGVSILPRSSLLPGMQVLPKGRDFPDPGRLDVGVLGGAGARAVVVAALEKVTGQTCDVLPLARAAAARDLAAEAGPLSQHARTNDVCRPNRSQCEFGMFADK